MNNNDQDSQPGERTSAARRFGQRLKRARTQLGFDVRQTSQAVGVGINSYYKYEDGSRFPGPGVLIAIVNKFRLNLNYLVSGEGPMFIAPGKDTGLKADSPGLATLFPGLDPELYSLVEDLQVPVMKHAMSMHWLVEKHKFKDFIKAYFEQRAKKYPDPEENAQ